jgi:CBS domain-containing protein
MLVREALGRPAGICGQDASLAQAARLMVDGDSGDLPVTICGYLIGLITPRDVLRAIADGRNPDQIKVGELMTPDPDSLEPDMDVKDAAHWMLAAGYTHLPVADEGKVLGMAGLKDMLGAVIEGATSPREGWAMALAVDSAPLRRCGHRPHAIGGESNDGARRAR